jgi:hypothetical protein
MARLRRTSGRDLTAARPIAEKAAAAVIVVMYPMVLIIAFR